MRQQKYRVPCFILSLLFLIAHLSTGWASTWPEPIFVKVADGFDQPVHLTHAGDSSGLLYIVEKQGKVKILKDNSINDEIFLDIVDRVRSEGEQGLLSIAFPPAYKDKRYFYVNYTDVLGNTTISRFYLETNSNRANSQSEEIILSINQPFPNHNGGQLAFGPREFLYIGMGDGGSAGDPFGSAQKGDTLLGKMLRIDVESNVKPYSIPDTNPFVSSTKFRPEIWALGLRNPWRFSFDRETGDLYIADVGQNLFEEVNVQFANSLGGENYGWNIFEGLHCFNSTACNQKDFISPVIEYGRSLGDVSVTGGFVYRGKEFPRMQSIYFFADFASGRVAGLRRINNQWESSVLADTVYNISSFGEDDEGQIYLLDLAGPIYRIEDNIKLSQIEFKGLLPQYKSGDTLQLSVEQTDTVRSTATDLWVALRPPNGDLLFFSDNPSQPFTTEPQPFIKKVKVENTNHSVLNIKIPTEITKGTYTFFALYNEIGASLNELSFTVRSNIAQITTRVVD